MKVHQFQAESDIIEAPAQIASVECDVVTSLQSDVEGPGAMGLHCSLRVMVASPVPRLLQPLTIEKQPGLVPVSTDEPRHQTVTQAPHPRAHSEDPRAEV